MNNNLADDSADIKRHALPERAASAYRCLVDQNNAIDRMKRLSTNFLRGVWDAHSAGQPGGA